MISIFKANAGDKTWRKKLKFAPCKPTTRKIKLLPKYLLTN